LGRSVLLSYGTGSQRDEHDPISQPSKVFILSEKAFILSESDLGMTAGRGALGIPEQCPPLSARPAMRFPARRAA
jgi:hypothetical protein